MVDFLTWVVTRSTVAIELLSQEICNRGHYYHALGWLLVATGVGLFVHGYRRVVRHEPTYESKDDSLGIWCMVLGVFAAFLAFSLVFEGISQSTAPTWYVVENLLK